MLAKDIEAKVKELPSRVKEENIRLTALSKGLANLNKAHQSKYGLSHYF
jgi:hypothetical protein